MIARDDGWDCGRGVERHERSPFRWRDAVLKWRRPPGNSEATSGFRGTIRRCLRFVNPDLKEFMNRDPTDVPALRRGRSAPTRAATTTSWSGPRARRSPRRAPRRRSRTSHAAPGSASAPSTGTSRPARTCSRPSTWRRSRRSARRRELVELPPLGGADRLAAPVRRLRRDEARADRGAARLHRPRPRSSPPARRDLRRRRAAARASARGRRSPPRRRHRRHHPDGQRHRHDPHRRRRADRPHPRPRARRAAGQPQLLVFTAAPPSWHMRVWIGDAARPTIVETNE